MEIFETYINRNIIHARVVSIISKAILVGGKVDFLLSTKDFSRRIKVPNTDPLGCFFSKSLIIEYPILIINTFFSTDRNDVENVIRETSLKYKVFDSLVNEEYFSNYPNDFNTTIEDSFTVSKKIEITFKQ